MIFFGVDSQIDLDKLLEQASQFIDESESSKPTITPSQRPQSNFPSTRQDSYNSQSVSSTQQRRSQAQAYSQPPNQTSQSYGLSNTSGAYHGRTMTDTPQQLRPTDTQSSTRPAQTSAPRTEGSFYSGGNKGNALSIPCESCPQDDCHAATLFCRNCRGYFCSSCDAQFHPTTNPLMSRHVRVKVEDHKPPLHCSEHPEEELSYYCLDCEGQCICAECAIRGSHRDHNVQTIRKSYVEVRKRMNELVSNLNAREDTVGTILNRIDQHKKEIEENTRSIKESMQLSINELREKLNQKEAELLNSAERFQEEQVGQLSEFVRYAEQKQESLHALIENMKQSASQSDEVSLLNYYGQSKQLAYDLLKETPIDVDLPRVSGRRCYLDTDSAYQQIEMLKGLQLSIASLDAQYPQGDYQPEPDDLRMSERRQPVNTSQRQTPARGGLNEGSSRMHQSSAGVNMRRTGQK
ncbi:putative b-box zinc finger family protein [Blattamonas nauphoetae]|uniref:B-box zinc finger family protein n=1 Tax=Blattamonas nauphoetae TaxID=2049346 RepID=A0ABQ9XPM1_9EUKA|nr:putative b-box zinc finger family protein [Blattamonas nauphoetae]